MAQVAYSIAQAAATTATSEATIAEEIRGGRLRVRIIGTTRVILHTDLAEWCAALPEFSQIPAVSAVRLLSAAT
jgi:hypothetical protein